MKGIMLSRQMYQAFSLLTETVKSDVSCVASGNGCTDRLHDNWEAA